MAPPNDGDPEHDRFGQNRHPGEDRDLTLSFWRAGEIPAFGG